MKTRKDLQLFSDYVSENNIDYRQFQKMYRNTSKAFYYKKTFDQWVNGEYYIEFKGNKVVMFSDNHAERLCGLCDTVKDNSMWQLKKFGMGYLKFCKRCQDTHEDCHADYQQKVRNIARGLPPYTGIPRPVKQPKKKVEEDVLNTGLSDYIDNEDCPLRVENQMRPVSFIKAIVYEKNQTKEGRARIQCEANARKRTKKDVPIYDVIIPKVMRDLRKGNKVHPEFKEMFDGLWIA